MKRIMHLGLYWGDPPLWEPPKLPKQKERDRQRVRELLEGVGMDHLFHPDQSPYDLKLEVCSASFHYLMEELQKDPHLASSWIRVDRIYTDHELSSAPLLIWHLTNQAIEDDWYDLKEDGYQGGVQASHQRCSVCRAELEQVRDLVVDAHKMGKRDLSLSYSFEIILSSHLARMLQEAEFSGFTLRPVWHYRKPHQGEPPLYQLVVTNILPPMASPPTEFEHEQRCEVCGTETKFVRHTHWWGRIQYYEETDIYYSRSVLEEIADFNVTWEKIGELPSWSRLVIITQKVYRWLREKGIKGWSVEPVYLVE